MRSYDHLRVAEFACLAGGALVNGRAKHFAMSEMTRAHVNTFWELLDDIFNVVLFLLLELELLVLPVRRASWRSDCSRSRRCCWRVARA